MTERICTRLKYK